MPSLPSLELVSCFKRKKTRPESPEGGSLEPPDVSLDPESPEGRPVSEIFKELLPYCNKIKTLSESKKNAEYKCNIINEACWSDDDIRRVWVETEGMEKYSSERNDRALVILLQLIEKHKKDLSNLIKGGYKVQKSEFWPIYGVRQSRTETEHLVFDQNTEDSSGVPRGHSWKPVVKSENMSRDAVGGQQGSIYIRIPLAEMLHNVLPEQTPRAEAPADPSSYKLIDGFPSRTDLRRRKSYIMSFDNITNNAEWVYEILNKETLADNCEQNVSFKVKGFGQDYDRGHLAAARNHRWCQEDVNDANLSSNIAPQHMSLNRGPWSTLENRCRTLADEDGICNVHVYTGPVYPRDMDPSELQEKEKKLQEKEKKSKEKREKRVPSHFFKVIIVEKEDGTVERVECYLAPNRITDKDRANAALPHTVRPFIEHIERESGLKFIERRPNVREERIIAARLQGEDPNGTPHHADIQARICQNNI